MSTSMHVTAIGMTKPSVYIYPQQCPINSPYIYLNDDFMVHNKITYVSKGVDDCWFVDPVSRAEKLVQKCVCNRTASTIALVECLWNKLGRLSECLRIFILQGALLGGRLQCLQGQSICRSWILWWWRWDIGDTLCKEEGARWYWEPFMKSCRHNKLQCECRHSWNQNDMTQWACGGQGMLSWIPRLDIIMEAPIFGLSQEISISYFIWSFVEQNVWVIKLDLESYYLMWNLGLCFEVLKCWLQSFTSRLTAWKYRGVNEVYGAPSSISHIIW